MTSKSQGSVVDRGSGQELSEKDRKVQGANEGSEERLYGHEA